MLIGLEWARIGLGVNFLVKITVIYIQNREKYFENNFFLAFYQKF